MSQITTGSRSILSIPLVYSLLQSLMGAHKGRQRFVADYIKPHSKMKILDVGCGPADILGYLPNVEYYGFDVSEQYIENAKDKFLNKGNFFCKIFENSDVATLPKVDVVLAMGLLHHLDDNEAVGLIELASKVLKPSGRLLTIDPCFTSNQNPVARFLINNDRGQNVRREKDYYDLAKEQFSSLTTNVIHQRWIPYTNCFMTCVK